MHKSMITVTRKSSGKGSPPKTSFFFMSSSTFMRFFSISSGVFAGALLITAFSKALFRARSPRLVPFHQQPHGFQPVPVPLWQIRKASSSVQLSRMEWNLKVNSLTMNASLPNLTSMSDSKIAICCFPHHWIHESEFRTATRKYA